EQQGATVLDRFTNGVNNAARHIQANGPSSGTEAELNRLQIITSEAVRNRLITPEKALEMNRTVAFQAKRAEALHRLRAATAPEGLIEQINDPSGHYARLGFDQQQRIAAEVEQQWNHRKALLEGDRVAVGEVVKARIDLAQAGHTIDIPSLVQSMTKTGYDP